MKVGDKYTLPNREQGTITEINGQVITVEVEKIVRTVETSYHRLPDPEPQEQPAEPVSGQ